MLTITHIRKHEGDRWCSETMAVLPEKIGNDSIVWVDAEDPSEAELALLRQYFPFAVQNLREFEAVDRQSTIEEIDDSVTCFLTFPNRKHFVSDVKNGWLVLLANKKLIASIHKGHCTITDEVHRKIKTHGYALTPSPSTDVLLYVFLDLVLTEYFAVSDLVHQRLEDLGSEAARLFRQKVLQSDRNFLSKVAELRDQVVTLRKPTGSLREVVGRLTRGEFAIVSENTLPRFESMYDKTISMIDSVGACREQIHDIGETLVNSLSVVTNSIIRILTIISAIFLPLTLIAGIYGTNFQHSIPGIGSQYGFYLMMALMVCLASGLIVLFKRKSWL